MRKFISVLLLLLVSVPAFAATKTLHWVAPTQNEDNSPLVVGTNPGDLKGYTIYRGTDPANLTRLAAVAAPALTYVDTASPDGATVYYAVTASNNAGAESVQSNVATVVNPPLRPKAPATLTVAALVAFMEVREDNALAMLAVGKVPGDTKCDPSQGVISNGAVYYAVPRDAVAFSGDVQPRVVFSLCS